VTTVLLVEDEELVALFVQLSLEDFGFTVEFCARAADAIAALEERRFDLAILDVGLPDMRGDELARRARALHADLPIILASGMRLDEVASSMEADPLVQFLGKPFDVGELLRVVRGAGIQIDSQTR
jgi:DNA-binding response OmpR family regulator